MKTCKKGDKLIYRKYATQLGLSVDYFYMLEVKHPLKFRFMRLYGRGNLAKGFLIFEEMLSGTLNKFFKEVYLNFKNESACFKWLADNGFFKTKMSASSTLRLTLGKEKTSLPMCKKLKKAIKCYKLELQTQKTV